MDVKALQGADLLLGIIANGLCRHHHKQLTLKTNTVSPLKSILPALVALLHHVLQQNTEGNSKTDFSPWLVLFLPLRLLFQLSCH